MVKIPYIDEELIGRKVVWRIDSINGDIKKGDVVGKVARINDDHVVCEIDDRVHDMIINDKVEHDFSIQLWEQGED